MKNGRKSTNIRARLCESLDIPADLILGGCIAELRGRGEITLCGCKKVLLFRPEIIKLEMPEFNFIIEGERLRCNTFCYSRVTIYGKIDSIKCEEKG